MKKTAIIISLMFFINSFGQKPIVKPPITVTPLSSLELETTIKLGKEFYTFIKKNETLRNEEYLIMFRQEIKDTITNYDPTIHGEGKDYDFELPFKGKFTGVTEQGFFKNGYKNGFWKTTYKNKLIKTINYNNGLVIGRYRVYNTEGDLLYKTTFSPQGNGKYKDYFNNTGILKEKGCYKNGKKEGKWHTYNEKGEIVQTINYSKGELIKKD